jgi:tyrosine-protein kinase Etk/Wzc
MGTERAIALSGAVAEPAAARLGKSEDEALDGLTVTVPVDTTVLEISYSADSADNALEGARAFTSAYMVYRNASAIASDEGPPPLPRNRPEVVGVITPPTLPIEPEPINYPVVLGISLLLGAAVGIGVAFLWDRVSGRLRDAADAEATFGIPVLASIPHVSAGAQPHVYAGAQNGVLDHRTGASGRAFGYLTAQMNHRFEDRKGNLLLVTSPVSGAGTTFVASNLAVALATTGRDVILVSSDMSDPNARPWFVTPNLRALDPATDLDLAVQSTKVVGLKLLMVDAWMSATGYNFEDVEVLIRRLNDRAQIVILDAPPILDSADSALIADRFESIVVVADLDRGVRSDAAAAMRALDHVRGRTVGTVVNHPRGNRIRRLFRSPRRVRTVESEPNDREGHGVLDKSESIGG